MARPVESRTRVRPRALEPRTRLARPRPPEMRERALHMPGREDEGEAGQIEGEGARARAEDEASEAAAAGDEGEGEGECCR